MVVTAPFTLVIVGVIVVASPDASTVTQGLGTTSASSRCATTCTSAGKADASPASSKLAAARSCLSPLLPAIVSSEGRLALLRTRDNVSLSSAVRQLASSVQRDGIQSRRCSGYAMLTCR